MNKLSSPLDTLRVASPCHASWEKMQGSDTSRFCADCKLNVYNISAMTKADAEAFLAKAEGRVCVRYYRRADGTIITADCPVGVQAARMRFTRRVRSMTAAALALVAGGVGLNSARAGGGERMGKMAPIATEVDRSLPSADTANIDQSIAPLADTVQGNNEPTPPSDMDVYPVMGGMMPMEYVQEQEPPVPVGRVAIEDTSVYRISVATPCGPYKNEPFFGSPIGMAQSVDSNFLFNGPVQQSNVIEKIDNDRVSPVIEETEVEERIAPEIVVPVSTLPPSHIE